MSFESFDLDPAVIEALVAIDFTKPTAVQEKTLPLILGGHDIIATAETGSGKTAACAIPLCSQIDKNESKIQVLIVVPTRELALQYATETQRIGKFKKVKTFAIFGGEDMDLQLAKLKAGVDVLVATPGRLIDLIYARRIDLTGVRHLVLDEADQMLSMGFIEDLEFIMDCLVQTHQVLLFSATMPKEIQDIAVTRMKNPQHVKLIGKKPAPDKLEHKFLFCRNPHKKQEQLAKLLDDLPIKQCIIFGNARHEVEKLCSSLKKKYGPMDYLHGGLDQRMRTSITGKFARGKLKFLVASDVAARGLDFSNVTHVINLHFPHDQESYLHRSGRTGRIGAKGTCVTLVTKRDFGKVKKLISYLKRKSPDWLGEAPKEF
ncbi:MAG: DEAD-box ATP-dependent RNA helicase CshA [Chlamydiales bacterium]|nr:DEAD-box ATP-dependent RNA helicase CshA [Chlamydiales bacterium]MCH9635472.1 DEAD-box ATP-dependent RNA helicase CshA [Chlamydiales bacterium]MCH9703171.1 DEAD/DEAH box helicase [Chlamydiota bacterium]